MSIFDNLNLPHLYPLVGLPPYEIPLALFMINVGVEVGQVMFLAVVLTIKILIARLKINWPQDIWKLLPYAIGSLAAFWVIQRTLSFI